ncbi:MAG: nucleotide-binding protein [Bacteroidota bacterium]
MIKPSIFIGSSKEALEFARAVQDQLSDVAVGTVWNELPFTPGTFSLEVLLNAVERFDFSVFVFSPDDKILSRGNKGSAPRDNVIFELGLFMGRLGKSRSFVLCQAKTNLKLLSDLSGLIFLSYEWPNNNKNMASAIGPACTRIRGAVRDLGLYQGNLKQLNQVKEDILEHERRLLEQQEIVNQLVIFSMSEPIFKKLQDLYLKKRYGGEYIYQSQYEEINRREFYYLRDHGYLALEGGGFFDPGPDLIGQDLVRLVNLTPIGNFFVEQREKLERELNDRK